MRVPLRFEKPRPWQCRVDTVLDVKDFLRNQGDTVDDYEVLRSTDGRVFAWQRPMQLAWPCRYAINVHTVPGCGGCGVWQQQHPCTAQHGYGPARSWTSAHGPA